MEAFGRIDVLGNNAGIGTANPATGEAPDDFRATIDVDLMGEYWMSQACARVMGLGSSSVNIASVLGLVTSYAPQASYAASEAVVIGLTRDLAQQWSGRRGIWVNALAPGYFASELTAEIPKDQLLTFIGQTSPLGRMGGVCSTSWTRRWSSSPSGVLLRHRDDAPGRWWDVRSWTPQTGRVGRALRRSRWST